MEKVKLYMNRIREYASSLLTQKLKELKRKSFRAIEKLDDGHALHVKIATQNEMLTIDFEGTSGMHAGNMNATPAIVNSVILYVLRVWVNQPIPLNEGLLERVKIILPTGMLNPIFSKDPKKCPAVVGGNTEVSQRLTDTLLKALKLSACSQGTMNNFLFGNERFGYYETICGGVGATRGHHGADAVHQHMTNTRITDPEILEQHYPVRLEKFQIRKGSGGKGRWTGGNGVERIFFFKDTLSVNLLAQHRIVTPYGMNGGVHGKAGEQFLIRAGGRKQKLGGVFSADVHPGDRLIIRTPGGGGWGKK